MSDVTASEGAAQPAPTFSSVWATGGLVEWHGDTFLAEPCCSCGYIIPRRSLPAGFDPGLLKRLNEEDVEVLKAIPWKRP